MGITFRSAKFGGAPPSLEEILGEATRMCGLPLEIRRSSSGSLFRYSAEVGFAVRRSERITVYAYDPDALRRFHLHERDLLQSPEIVALTNERPSIARAIERADSLANHDPAAACVHLRGGVSEEGTIGAVLALALESLGGLLTPPISDAQRRAGAGPITAAELRRRPRANARAWMAALSSAPWQLLKMKWRGGRR